MWNDISTLLIFHSSGEIEMPELPNFRNASLLSLALTHRSYRDEHGGLEDNERLKYLGNSVLVCLSSAYLYKLYPEMGEGELTYQRSSLINENQLAKFAIVLGIDKQMLVGTEVVKEEGNLSTKLLSNIFQAIIGAYFLDSGIDAVRAFVKPLFTSVLRKTSRSRSSLDYKALFQQWSLLNVGQVPDYFILEESEPDCPTRFTAAACVSGEVYGVATESTQKAAEKLAAEAALKKLGLMF
jgi:ribonuclease-3